MRASVRVVTAGLALLAACSTVEFGPPAPLGAAASGTLLATAAKQLARLAVTPGAIAPPREGTMAVGDRAWFALELRDDGTRTQWLLGLQALTEESAGSQQSMTLDANDGRKFTLHSGMTILAVSVFGPFTEDQEAEAATTGTVVSVPAAFLREGLSGACEVGMRNWRALEGSDTAALGTVSDADLRTYCGGFATLLAFLQIVQDNEVLSSVLWKVIEKPSPLAVLLAGFSVSLGIDPHFRAIETVEHPLPGVPAGYRLPLDLRINAKPALRTELLVVKPDPPLQICGGIVALEGRHPGRPTRTLSLWLLAADARQRDVSARR